MPTLIDRGNAKAGYAYAGIAPTKITQLIQTCYIINMTSSENRKMVAVELTKEAENYLVQGKLDEAISCYQKAISLDPNFAENYRHLASIWTKKGNSEAAAECWYQALTLEPNWATADEHITLGNTLVEQDKLEQAIQCYRAGIALNPKLAIAYHNLGEVLRSQNQWEEAISCYHQAIQIDPEFSSSHYGLGKALAKRGELESAIASYRKTIELEPNQASAYQSLAEALQAKSLFDEAAVNYQRAIELNPDFYWLHHNLGYVFSKLEQWDKAVVPYRRASQLNPDFFWSYYNLGYALNQLERWEEAVAAYGQGIKLNSDFFWLHNNLGYALLELERWEEAIATYRRALEIKADFFWSHYKLGEGLSHIQQWDEAVSAYLHAILINPDMPEIYSKLGNALRKQSKSGLESVSRYYCQAIEVDRETGRVYNNVLKIHSEQPDFYWQLGETLFNQNKFEGAIIFYQMALQVDSENTEISLQLERAIEKKHQLDAELASYRHNIELEPNNPKLYSYLGNRLVELDDIDEAISCHQKASELRGWHLCAAKGYQFTQDWFTHNIPVWQHYLQSFAGKPQVNVLEIGSFQGMSTCWLLDHILTQPTAKITCIDLGFQKQYHPNVAKTEAANKVIKLQGKSQEILPTLNADAYDLAYIDGCHKSTSVLEDALLSWKLVKVGGTIIFDDYEWVDPETKAKVTKIGIDNFLLAFENQVEVLYKSYQLIIKKISNEGNKDTGKPEDKALWVKAYQSLGDAIANTQLEAAEFCYRKAIELQPNRGSLHHKLAKVFQDREEFELAADAYRRAVEIDPNVSWSYHNLGDVLLKLEKWEEASVAYRRAIELKPDFHWSYNNLGMCLSQQEKWEESIPAYRRAIELNPDFFGSHHHLGDALIKQEKWDEGVAACLRAIELNPDFSWSYQNLGDVLIKQEKWEEAAAAYRRVVELNPEAGWCYQSLGEILEEQQKWEEAAAAYRRGRELELDNSWLYKKLGDVLQKLGLWDEAIAIYQEGIGVDLQAYFCYEGVGLCLLEKQDWEGAIASFIQALQIKPDLLEVYHKIGYALEQQGELEKSEWGCCEYQMLPLKVLKKYCDFNENLTVTSESEPSINYISIFPADEISLLPSKSLDSNPIFSGSQYYSPKTFVAVVPEGRAWADVITTAVITSENKLVTDLSTGCAELVLSSNRLAPIEYIDGTVAFLSVRWGGAAYYHWMFDVIPRFELLRRSGIDINAIDKFIVNGTEHSYEKETLKTLGIPETKIIESSRGLHIQAKNLVIPSNCYQGISQISKWGCEFIKKEFLPENGTQTIEKSKRIYISRNLASYRKVVNEEELLNFLEPWGFESVKLETMSVTEQASCLASAEVVVAPHGAGLTNIVFCSPGTKIIEIFSPTYLPSCYWILSNVGGLEHYYLIGDLLSNSASTLPIHKDIKVNLELLENLIRNYKII